MTTRNERPPHRPFYARLQADLLEGRQELSDRLATMAEGAAGAARALAARARYSSTLGVNVVGVGLGEKVSQGKRTGALSIQVLVARKFPKGRIPRDQLLPRAVAGLPTDVVDVGWARKLTLENRLRQRPLRAGSSISPSRDATRPNVMAGTLGVFTRDRATGTLHVLSNNHVIANENAVPVGDPLLQPGSLDGGVAGDVVGRVSHVVPLKYGNARNWMDAAAAAIDDATAVDGDRATVGLGPPRGAAKVKLNTAVRKSGRTSGLTEGIVRTVKLDVLNVEYEGGMVRVDDVFAVEGVGRAFSQGGDSGSGVVDASGAVVGLLFAGTDTQTFVIPIQRILRRLRMRIA